MTGERLGIVGVGLIGGSIALRGRATHAAVIGFDNDAATSARALARGIIDEAAPDLESVAQHCDTLVIALPLDATRAALERLAGRAGPSLIIDVASVKAPLVSAGGRVANYVGTHPMAGREQGGIDAADPGLFEHATWAYTPHPDPLLTARTRAFIALMGAEPVEVDPERHDAVVALTSHLPQMLSVLLGAELNAAACADGQVMNLCGPGIIGMLRLARSPESMWAPIVAANALPIARRLRAMALELEGAAGALEAGDSAPMLSYFASARAAAAMLEERFPPAPRSSSAYSLPPAAPPNSVFPPTR